MKIQNILIACALTICASCGNSHHSNHSHGHVHDVEETGHAEHSDHSDHSEEAHSHSEHDAHKNEHSHMEHEVHQTEHKHEHNANEIVFEAHKAKKFGVLSEVIKPTSFNEIFKVSGEIISAQGDSYVVSAKSSGIVSFNKSIAQGVKVAAGQTICLISASQMVGGDANQSAKVSFQNAKREFERIKPLYEARIVTEKEYLQALENYEKAKLAYKEGDGFGTSAASAISGTITQLNVSDGAYVEAGTPIAVVSKNTRLQLHADLPQRYFNKVNTIKSANFKTSYNPDVVELSSVNGKRISSSDIVATNGYIPVVFEFDNDNTLASGTFADVYLIGSLIDNAIVVPIGAITEEMNNFFVYAKLDESCYEKIQVTIGGSNGKYAQILSGVKAGDEIVTVNPVYVKLAANSGAIPAGHSHNH